MAAVRLRSLVPATMMVLLLAACGTASHTGSHQAGGRYLAGHPSYKIGAPYEIGGVWYYPKVDYDYDKAGVASWYGEQFNQKYTANGEIFDLNQLTAAHPTLPMPSVVEVTNLDNGREVQLRVNDRGPYANGRIIDVSRRAAQLLGFETRGTARVRVKIMKDESIQVAEEAMRNEGAIAVADAAPAMPWPPARPAVPTSPFVPPPFSPPPVAAPPVAPTPVVSAPLVPPPAPVVVAQMPPLPETVTAAPTSAAGRIFIQAGAFSVRDNAQRVQSHIAGLGNVQVTAASVNGTEIYRVRLGPLMNVEEADRLLARLAGSGYPEARIVAD